MVHINLKQDVDTFELLSLKLKQEDLYRLQVSNYGVVVGRVLANGGFGIPNAKVSVFVEVSQEDKMDNILNKLYPYSYVTSTDQENRRYNLLPNEEAGDCQQIVGTFPNKRMVLDNNDILEVYDKYWKYTTTTNHAGDYMIYGVPTGNQVLHLDVDMSDIGALSQTPRDFLYKGYNENEFENPRQFKYSTRLDMLPQIFSQNENVYVYPFWGDNNQEIIAITRADLLVDYTFEPTCVFMGSIVTDNVHNAIGQNCRGGVNGGKNKTLVAGSGRIEMIRKTLGGNVEEYTVEGGDLIDGAGVWCYQIPMNLDYVVTDEYGNIVPTDNPSIGIPTRASVRFRVSYNNNDTEGSLHYRGKYLIPNNPELVGNEVNPQMVDAKQLDDYFEFGSNTPDNCFRDLYWNKVYSVKNYIPRLQTTRRINTSHYSALKLTNYSEDKNPIPFNKLRVHVTFMYAVICMITDLIFDIASIINKILSIKIWFIDLSVGTCIKFCAGFFRTENNQNVTYVPGCNKRARAFKKVKCCEPGCSKDTSEDNALDNVQQNLATEFETANLDFYNDWINGALYLPTFSWKRKTKKWFGKKTSYINYCSCNNHYNLYIAYPCALPVSLNMQYTKGVKDNDYHTGSKYVSLFRVNRGVIKEHINQDNLPIYYYTPGNLRTDVDNIDSQSFVRLYATDIINLGSLNDCDIDGTPQFIKHLPSTSANIPPIATLYEDEHGDEIITENEILYAENGAILETGMDWTSKSKPSDDPSGVQYVKGTIFDLTCTGAKTQPKTCVNVERLCELNVDNDEAYPYMTREGVTKLSRPDGMISREELDYNDPRAMFATLNHNGFVPVTKEGDINLQTKVYNEKSGYYKDRYHFLYPQNFDGRLSQVAPKYTANATDGNVTYDMRDDDYIAFRFGPDAKHHFYNDGAGGYRFPLYNNSFYFYFGLYAGETAIDQFYRLYMGDCVKRTKNDFAIQARNESAKLCPQDLSNDFATITLNMKGVLAPYSYTLEKNGEIILSESDMSISKLLFGYKVKEGGNGYIENEKYGHFVEFKTGRDTNIPVTNGLYTITIVDSTEQVITQNITITEQQLSLGVESYSLGVDYESYPDEDTAQREICNSEANLSGDIYIKNVNTNNKLYTIKSVENSVTCLTSKYSESNSYKLKVQSEDGEELELLLEIGVADSNADKYESIQNYACSVWADDIFDNTTGFIHFNIFKPCKVLARISQFCEGEIVNSDCLPSGSTLEDSSFTTTFVINNGTNLNVFINDIPIEWLQPNPGVSFNAIGPMVNFPDVYHFPQLTDESWNTYILEQNEKSKVQFAFETIFSLSSAMYVTDNSNNYSTIRGVGGKAPLICAGGYPSFVQLSSYLNSLNNVTADAESKKTISIMGTEIMPSVLMRDNHGYVATDGIANIAGPNANYDVGSVNWPTQMFIAVPHKDDYNIARSYSSFQVVKTNEFTGKYNHLAVFTNNGGLSSINGKCQVISGYQAMPTNAVIDKEICNGPLMNQDSLPALYDSYYGTSFVDKRFDYEGVFYTAANVNRVAPASWREARLCLDAYNGIQMKTQVKNVNGAEERHLISSTSGETEYWYEIDQDKLNIYCANGNDKEYYSTTLTYNDVNLDLTQHFSSVKHNSGSQQIQNDSSARAYYHETITGQRGRLKGKSHSNIDTADLISYYAYTDNANNPYPIMHNIDICSLPYSSAYTFINTSYSYDVPIEINAETNEVQAIATEGETVKFTVNMGNNIQLGEYRAIDGSNYLLPNDTDFVYSGAVSGDTFISQFQSIPYSNVGMILVGDNSDEQHVGYMRQPRVFDLLRKNNSLGTDSDLLQALKYPTSSYTRLMDKTNNTMSITEGEVQAKKAEIQCEIEMAPIGGYFYDSSGPTTTHYRYIDQGCNFATSHFNTFGGGYTIEKNDVTSMGNSRISFNKKDAITPYYEPILTFPQYIGPEWSNGYEFTTEFPTWVSNTVRVIGLTTDYLSEESVLLDRRIQVWDFSTIIDLRQICFNRQVIVSDDKTQLTCQMKVDNVHTSAGTNKLFAPQNTVASFWFEGVSGNSESIDANIVYHSPNDITSGDLDITFSFENTFLEENLPKMGLSKNIRLKFVVNNLKYAINAQLVNNGNQYFFRDTLINNASGNNTQDNPYDNP